MEELPLVESLRRRVDELAKEAARLEAARVALDRAGGRVPGAREEALLAEVASTRAAVVAAEAAVAALRLRARGGAEGAAASRVFGTFVRRAFVLAGWLLSSAWLGSTAGPLAGGCALAAVPLVVFAARLAGRWWA